MSAPSMFGNDRPSSDGSTLGLCPDALGERAAVSPCAPSCGAGSPDSGSSPTGSAPATIPAAASYDCPEGHLAPITCEADLAGLPGEGYGLKTPFATKAQLERLAGEFPTPFHLYDEAGVRATARTVREAFSWNPGFREFFAVKATPNPRILQILAEEGCGVDCASACELMLADASGITGRHIMFSSNDTPAEDFQLAARLGAIVNFDDISHLDFYERVAGPIPEVVSCRFNPGGLFRLSNGIMDNPGDAKYGMTEEQLFEAYRQLVASGAKTLGLHAFLASNTLTNDYYPRLAGVLFELAVRLARETGAHIGFINLSGGVGVPYLPGQAPCDIRAIGGGVRREFERVLVPAGMGDVAIFTEMGRYMLGPHGCLVTRAIHHKHIHKEYVGVDACSVNLMRPAMYRAYHHISVVGQPGGPDKTRSVPSQRYDVVGSLCENNDKFAIDRLLPEVEEGDLLVIHDSGAHGFSMGYNYNGRLRSAEVLLREDGSGELIRRAEEPRDYFATFDSFPIGARLKCTSSAEYVPRGEG